MSRTRTVPPAVLAAVTSIAVVCLAAAGGAGAAVGPKPVAPGSSATVSDVHVGHNGVDLTLFARRLPAGARLDPASVRVTVGSTALRATATAVNADAPPTDAREVILALDTSGSMARSGIAAARDAANSYAAKLPADVRVGLLTFSASAHVLLAPTTDRARLHDALARARTGGKTALFDGVIAAARAVGGRAAAGQRRLVVLSDGRDTVSTHSLADVTSALAAAHVAADVVAFRLPGDDAVLNRIASSAHGRVLPASDASGLASAFSAAASAFVPELHVHADVPAALAGRVASLQVSARSGSVTVSASSPVRLPGSAATGSAAAGPRAAERTPTAQTATKARLWLTLGLVFAGLLAVLLLTLLLPGARRELAARAARLDEVNRYRVVSAMAAGTAFTSSEAGTAAATTAFAEQLLAFVDRGVRARGYRDRVLHELERAGLRMRPEEWVALQLSAAVVPCAVIGLLSGSVIGAVAGLAAGIVVSRVFVRLRIRRRADAFLQQLPDALQLLASSLRSGFSLTQALASVVREGSEPVSSEFARALTEARLGAELEDALDAAADRMRCMDLRWVVIAIRISREVGGNLAEVLLTTVATMRERAEVRGQVRVLSAEGRISAKVLIGLPFFIGAVLSVIRPGYFDPLLHTGAGLVMLGAGAVLLALGSLWISKLVKIEV